MKISAAVKAAVQKLAKQQTEQELSAREKELAEHITTREQLRQQLAADAESDAAEQRRYDAAREALVEFGRIHSWEQRNSSRELAAEGLRLAAAVQQAPKMVSYSRGCSPREFLVKSCRDSSLQAERQAAVVACAAAVAELEEHETADSAAAELASVARRERLGILGSIRQQFGAEGGRWVRTETESGEIEIQPLQNLVKEPAIHPENAAFLNRQLSPFNRRIREYRARMNSEELPQLQAAVASCRSVLNEVESRMMQSEI